MRIPRRNTLPAVARIVPLLCRGHWNELVGWFGLWGGAIIDGALLENLGSKGKKITAAFKLTLDDVLNGRKISSKSQDQLTVTIPKILYRPLAAFLNYNTRKSARKNGITDLSRKYYLA